MNKYIFLVQCGTHCGALSGKLAILTTNTLKDKNNLVHDSPSVFCPGTHVAFVPMDGGSSFAMIIADLTLTESIENTMNSVISYRRDMPEEWLSPQQIIEVRKIYTVPI